MSADDTMRAFHDVLGAGGVIVGRHGHHLREGDARSFRQDGD